MATQQRSILFFVSAFILCTGTVTFYAPLTEASIVVVRNRNIPQLRLRVGAGGGTISKVTFPVPVSQVGNGSPIQGNRRIRMDMRIRARPAFTIVATLTVDSSNPLTNGSITLPMSNISWTAQDGDIPSGTFNNTTNQFIVSYPNSFRIRDWHRFFYANTQILEPGTYNGRVTYTLATP